MTDQYVGEIRIFASNFAPNGWALCNGQVLAISQNTALFSLLGTMYGGNGTSTFALPDFQGRAPINQGQGPGLTPRVVGEAGGSATATVTTSQMPSHSHALRAHGADFGDVNAPSTAVILARSQGALMYGAPDAGPVQMAAAGVGTAGGTQPHNNLEPYLTLNFCISLVGIYPPRS